MIMNFKRGDTFEAVVRLRGPTTTGWHKGEQNETERATLDS